MAAKRPTRTEAPSDDDLLEDSVSAKIGDGTEEIDEDALLDSDGEENQSYILQGDIVETVDLGLNVSDVGFDDTANSQELDYEDIPEEVQQENYYGDENDEETEDPLMVDDQPNETTCVAQPTEPVEDTVYNDEDSDDEGKKKERDRFQTERNTVSLATVHHSKSSTIPDSLEITKEMQEEIESFEKQKGKGKFNKNKQQASQNRRGGQQQQRFHAPSNRASNRQRGGQFGNRMPRGRFYGPRNGNSIMPPRGPHSFDAPRGPPPGQGYIHRPLQPQGFNPKPIGHEPGMNGGRPVFHHEMMVHQEPHMSHQQALSTHIPQQIMSMPNQSPHHYQDQQQQQFTPPLMEQTHTQYQVPQPEQPHYIQPQHLQPRPLLQHSQPQPLLPPPQPLLPQSIASTIHVNPNFQGPLPANIRPQPGMPPQSVQQPMYSQPKPLQQFQDPSQNWPRHSTPGQTSYAQAPSPNQQVMSYANSPGPSQPGMMFQRNDRPGLLGSPPARFSPPRHRFPGGSAHHPHQIGQGQPQELGQNQPFLPRPQAPHFQFHSRGPQQGNLRPRGVQKGNVQPTSHQMQQQRMQVPMEAGAWNPKPEQLVPQAEVIDSEKLKKIQELEEKKRLRAERFKTNTEVKVEEGKTTKKKIILTSKTPKKRPSGDSDKTPNDLSPPKVIRLSQVATAVSSVKVEPDLAALAIAKSNFDVSKEMDLDMALEEQKRKRELIQRAKEAKRRVEADKRKNLLAKKLAHQAKARAVAAAVKPASTPQQGHLQGQHQGQYGTPNQFQGQQNLNQFKQQNFQQTSQQNFQRQQNQQKQFNQTSASSNLGNQMGQMAYRSQKINRGQGFRSQGQPISVLGHQGYQTIPQSQIGQMRGRGKVRGQGHRGRGRGMQKFQNVVQLQQVELHNVEYENTELPITSIGSNNRTVIPASSSGRQVLGVNSMGAASQSVPERIVFEKVETSSPQRRIVIDAKMSSTVMIKDVPAKVDLGKISARCAQFGKTKMFNYKAVEKIIVVQFSKPSEAAAFLNKSFRFMIDMNYYTAVSIPDDSV